MPHWRLLLSPASTGADNMALDEALMDRARETGEWVLRVYAWSAPTISLGRNQSARGRYDLDQVAHRGVAVVRRPTGGRAILHDREITYSVTAPAASAGDLATSYRRINALLLDALGQLGVDVVAARPASRARPPGPTPCFAEPAAGELTVDGRKLAGSAQWRCDGALLQHGSILVHDDQRALADLTIGEATRVPAPATLSGALGWSPAPRDIADALAAAVRRLEDPDATTLELDDAVRARAAALVVRYLDDTWTWRR